MVFLAVLWPTILVCSAEPVSMLPVLSVLDSAERAVVDAILAEQRRANVCSDQFAAHLGQRQVVPTRRSMVDRGLRSLSAMMSYMIWLCLRYHNRAGHVHMVIEPAASERMFVKRVSRQDFSTTRRNVRQDVGGAVLELVLVSEEGASRLHSSRTM